MSSFSSAPSTSNQVPARKAAPWVLALCLVASSVHAQNANQGRSLFEDTINASGLSGLTGNCTSCHRTVQERRAKIGGAAFAEIGQALASERLRLAIQSVGAMQQFDAMSPEQVNDLAAYLADTPRRSVAQLDLSAPVVNAVSPAQFVELQHAEATTDGLTVVSVALTGASADNARFTRSADTCDQQTLAPATGCRVTLTYMATDTAPTSTSLTLTLRQGNSVPFVRTVALNGSVAGTSPPDERPNPEAPTPDDSGGGALGAGWLAGMAWAVALLACRADRVRPTRHEPSTQPLPNPGDIS